jgi:hypothetical protein
VSARCSMVQQLSTNGRCSGLCKAPTRQGTRRAMSNLCLERKHSRKYCLCGIITIFPVDCRWSYGIPTSIHSSQLRMADLCSDLQTHNTLELDGYILFGWPALIDQVRWWYRVNRLESREGLRLADYLYGYCFLWGMSLFFVSIDWRYFGWMPTIQCKRDEKAT